MDRPNHPKAGLGQPEQPSGPQHCKLLIGIVMIAIVVVAAVIGGVVSSIDNNGSTSSPTSSPGATESTSGTASSSNSPSPTQSPSNGPGSETATSSSSKTCSVSASPSFVQGLSLTSTPTPTVSKLVPRDSQLFPVAIAVICLWVGVFLILLFLWCRSYRDVSMRKSIVPQDQSPENSPASHSVSIAQTAPAKSHFKSQYFKSQPVIQPQKDLDYFCELSLDLRSQWRHEEDSIGIKNALSQVLDCREEDVRIMSVMPESGKVALTVHLGTVTSQSALETQLRYDEIIKSKETLKITQANDIPATKLSLVRSDVVTHADREDYYLSRARQHHVKRRVNTSEPATSIDYVATLKLGTSFDDWTESSNTKFLKAMATLLRVDLSNLVLIFVKPGSVIISFVLQLGNRTLGSADRARLQFNQRLRSVHVKMELESAGISIAKHQLIQGRIVQSGIVVPEAFSFKSDKKDYRDVVEVSHSASAQAHTTPIQSSAAVLTEQTKANLVIVLHESILQTDHVPDLVDEVESDPEPLVETTTYSELVETTHESVVPKPEPQPPASPIQPPNPQSQAQPVEDHMVLVSGQVMSARIASFVDSSRQDIERTRSKAKLLKMLRRHGSRDAESDEDLKKSAIDDINSLVSRDASDVVGDIMKRINSRVSDLGEIGENQEQQMEGSVGSGSNAEELDTGLLNGLLPDEDEDGIL